MTERTGKIVNVLAWVCVFAVLAFLAFIAWGCSVPKAGGGYEVTWNPVRVIGAMASKEATTRPVVGPTGEPPDESIATLLGIAAGIIGIPGLTLIGKLWGRVKPMKMLAEVVANVQDAKDELKADNLPAALAIVKEKLSNQSPELVAAVKKIKKAKKPQPVTPEN